MKEYISVVDEENREEYKFVKPDFECELLRVLTNPDNSKHIVGFIKDIDSGYCNSCQWDKRGNCWDIHNKRTDYHLTPYPQKWHDIEDNFPALVRWKNTKGRNIYNVITHKLGNKLWVDRFTNQFHYIGNVEFIAPCSKIKKELLKQKLIKQKCWKNKKQKN